jgi:uncharacterized HhH-GPD family protein
MASEAPNTVPVTGDAEADALLAANPFALLVGMLLDQQVPMEWAFRGPYTLSQRLGTTELGAGEVAALGPDRVEELFRDKPALHRYPGSMGKRTHALAQYLVDHYNGDAAKVWEEAADGKDLLRRLQELPGYGPDKSKIFAALLAKRFGVRPEGWEEAAEPFSDDTKRSVADIDSPETLAEVRAWKQAQKAKGKTKAD